MPGYRGNRRFTVKQQTEIISGRLPAGQRWFNREPLSTIELRGRENPVVIKLKAEVAGEDHQISIQPGAPIVLAEVDGRSYKLELRDLGAGEYLLIDGNTVYHCRVENRHNHSDDIEVSLRGYTYQITLTDPKRLRSAQSGADHDKGAARIVAPMPGKVVRVLVEAGVEVEAGAGILVVEAMKMQNEMKSPKAGHVVSIDAQVGSTVNAGDVLAVIE